MPFKRNSLEELEISVSNRKRVSVVMEAAVHERGSDNDPSALSEAPRDLLYAHLA